MAEDGDTDQDHMTQRDFATMNHECKSFISFVHFMCIGNSVYMHTYIHTYVHTYIHTYINTYIHAYIHSYICTYIHTYAYFDLGMYRYYVVCAHHRILGYMHAHPC